MVKQVIFIVTIWKGKIHADSLKAVHKAKTIEENFSDSMLKYAYIYSISYVALWKLRKWLMDSYNYIKSHDKRKGIIVWIP